MKHNMQQDQRPQQPPPNHTDGPGARVKQLLPRSPTSFPTASAKQGKSDDDDPACTHKVVHLRKEVLENKMQWDGA